MEIDLNPDELIESLRKKIQARRIFMAKWKTSGKSCVQGEEGLGLLQDSASAAPCMDMAMMQLVSHRELSVELAKATDPLR